MALPPISFPAKNSTLMRTAIRSAAVLAAGLTLAACHPGNQEAKQLRASCEGGDAAACGKFAVKLQKGEYVLRDETRAAALFDRACTGGVGDGCASLGAMLQTGTGVKRDSVRARDLLQRGCERKAMDGCARLGILYKQGAGVPQDLVAGGVAVSASLRRQPDDWLRAPRLPTQRAKASLRISARPQRCFRNRAPTRSRWAVWGWVACTPRALAPRKTIPWPRRCSSKDAKAASCWAASIWLERSRRAAAFRRTTSARRAIIGCRATTGMVRPAPVSPRCTTRERALIVCRNEPLPCDVVPASWSTLSRAQRERARHDERAKSCSPLVIGVRLEFHRFIARRSNDEIRV